MRKLGTVLAITALLVSGPGFQLGSNAASTPTSIGPISLTCTDQGPGSTTAQMDCVYSIPVVDQNGITMRVWQGSLVANGNNAVKLAAADMLEAVRDQAEALIQ